MVQSQNKKALECRCLWVHFYRLADDFPSTRGRYTSPLPPGIAGPGEGGGISKDKKEAYRAELQRQVGFTSSFKDIECMQPLDVMLFPFYV